MRELQVVTRGRTNARGTDGTVSNSRYVEQLKVVDLI
jgi:hypothetical protein